jgi:import inner membrane translocase subunit TIM23
MNAQTLLRSTRAARLPTHLGVRAASTSTSTTTAPPPSTANEKLPLSWPTYLSLRRQRRLWSTLTSIPTTAIGLVAGGGYFGSQEMDPSQLIMGIEPMWVYGGAT